MKIQNKIAILFTALTAAIMLLVSLFIYYFASRNTFQHFYHRMEVRAKIVAQATMQEDTGNTQLYIRVKEEQLENLPFEKDYFLRLKPDTPQLAEKSPLPLPAYFYERVLQDGGARYHLGGTFYVGYYAGKWHNFIVVTSAQDVYGMEELHGLRRVLVTGFLVFTVLMFTAGKLFSRQIFQPIRTIVQNVQKISANNLHLRLDTGNGKDEVAELALTFNDMLARLETTFESQNNFISNASHEFRTPLTIISGEAELGIQKAGASPELAASFQLILAEAERLDHLVSSLLSLAQTGFDGKKMQWELIRLDELLWSVKNTADQIYPGNKVCLDFNQLPEEADNLSTEGSLTLLKLAISNVVLNACKYSNNQRVILQLTGTRKVLTVTVIDQGIGIPQAEIPQVFVPFFRASNTSEYEGYGIGLPLTLNIIRLHKGSIEIEAKEMQGTTVKIHLPVKV
ncbi:HAMP domain-containing sensor histidine kinase [uncultured Chitinophaga sp.]|jgi:Signal transduction histidine kinase|uniref:HAMP domain-containing sensor histidine kinase n=1 Tax=uncultured Chitinophaga sp. TaxID=339340 RepID=UPI00260F2BAB|nr:HAMP domain-containing sensor histidine kinase [uncultured Chitinophaga sp.]